MHHHQWYSRQQPLYRQRYPFTIGISLSNTRETRAAAEATQAGSSSCRDSERAFYLTLRSSSSSRHTVGYGKFKKIIHHRDKLKWHIQNNWLFLIQTWRIKTYSTSHQSISQKLRMIFGHEKQFSVNLIRHYLIATVSPIIFINVIY